MSDRRRTRIAILGFAGRFPGAPDVSALWRSVREGRVSIARLTGAEAVANGARPDDVRSPAWVGAEPVLDGIELFDAAFFGISPREAQWMSPEQRILLELCVHALEHARVPVRGFAGRIGVFVGGGPSVAAYATGLGRADEIQGRSATIEHLGNDKDYLASRVAYALDLRGPAVVVQSACSTGLLAVHLAARALRDGECDVAIAGAAAIRVPHGVGYLATDSAVLSPDGTCRPMDAAAAGTVFGSGAGVVVLSREDRGGVDEARARAWLIGSAAANDGRQKASYAASSARGIAEVVGAALEDAGVSARSVGYLELHGTATALGDPTEIQGLTRIFREHTPDVGFCALGAIKANIGHADAAAGVAGLLAAVGALEAREIPPIASLATPNPQIPFASTPFRLPRAAGEAWVDPAPRRAGVTALGIGGTNVHVVLEEAEPPAVGPPALSFTVFDRQRFWLVLGERGRPRASTHLLSGGDLLRVQLDPQVVPWLLQHRVRGRPVLPGVATLELACRLAEQIGDLALDELVLEAPIVLTGPAEIEVYADAPGADGRRAVRIDVQIAGEPAARVARGMLGPAEAPPDTLHTWPPPGTEPVDVGAMYSGFETRGMGYGPAFRVVRSVFRGPTAWFAELALPEAARSDAPWPIHPALLDGALHLLEFAENGPLRLPFTWSRAAVWGRGGDRLRVRVERLDSGAALTWWDARGLPVARVGSVLLRPAVAEAGQLFKAVWVPAPSGSPSEPHAVVRWLADEPLPVATERAVAALQQWQQATALGPLVWVTSGSVAVRATDSVPDLAHAPLWGLARSFRAEHPERRLVLVDTDRSPASAEILGRLLSALPDVPELAVRDGEILVPRLVPAEPPAADPALDALLAERPPEGPTAGSVSIAVRAAGVNFRDVLAAEGRYPGGPVPVGIEGAGVVVEVHGDAGGLQVGDAVLGLMDGAFGTRARADARTVRKIPPGWSFERAASVPMAYLTACYALHDLAQLKPGERVLIHAAAGGVGGAAVQVARALGAEIYATASPSKHAALREAGIPADRIASSRTVDFEAAFLRATGGRGFDVVLDALAGPFVDASLRLLPSGGRFLEMGKTDVRDAARVAQDHPGVVYRAFDLAEAGPERIGALLDQVLGWLADGRLQPIPVTTFPRTRATEALRFVAQAKHVGKVVLAAREGFDPAGTVLITGGTGALGRQFARHLVTHYGARHLRIVSRTGPAAPGIDELVRDLAAHGAEVEVRAADLGDVDQVRTLLSDIPPDRPLTAVLHAAGILEDALLANLDPARLRRVLRAKVDGALHLHELTRRDRPELAWFVLFSSVAGQLPAAGQSAYAAANAALDALAAHRRALGLPATSLAWGPWGEAGMAARLDARHQERLRRRGLGVLPVARALALFDEAMTRPEPVLAPMIYDPPAEPAARRSDPVAAPRTRLAARLGSVPAAAWLGEVVAVVRAEAAAVLGTADVEAEQTYTSSGLDSMMLVELRHRLEDVVGERLPVGFAHEHPTPAATAAVLLSRIRPPPAAPVLERAPRPPGPPVASLVSAALTVLLPVLILAASGWMLEKVRSREEREEMNNAGRVVNGHVLFRGEVGSVVGQMDRTIARYDPRVVVLGNSLSHTDIVPALLENHLGYSPQAVQVFSVPRSVGTHWYAILENRIVRKGYRPDVVLVLSDLQSLLVIQPSSEASYINLTIQLGEDEPLIDAKVHRGGFWFDRLRENRSRVKNQVMERIRNASANLYLGRLSLADLPKVDAALESVFADDKVDITLAGNVMPTFTKEKEIYAFDPASLPTPEESFIGPITSLARDNGIRAVFVRPPMSPLMPDYAGDVVPAGYEERVHAIVEANGGTYLDLRDLPMSHGQFRNIDHMNPGGARRFTAVVADRIRDTAPGAEKTTDLLQSPRLDPRDLALPTPPLSVRRGKHGFVVPELSVISDEQTATHRALVSRCSPVRVTEDGALLAEHNVTCSDLARRSIGGVCHVGDAVFFTSSDGTSPTNNGRSYTLSLDPERRCDEALWLYPRDRATFPRPADGSHLQLEALAFGKVARGGLQLAPTTGGSGSVIDLTAAQQGLLLELPPGSSPITLTNTSDGYVLVKELRVRP